MLTITLCTGAFQTRVGAEDHKVGADVHVHCPRHAVVKNDVALQPDERRGEIVHGETVRFAVILRVLAEIVACVRGNGQGLGIPDGVQGQVEGIAAEIPDRAEHRLILFDKGAARNPAPTAAADLDVVHLAQLPGCHDPLDLFAVVVVARLETDGQDLAALFLRAHDGESFLQGDAHRLFEQHVLAGLQCHDRTDRVLAVVGADGHRVDVVPPAQLLTGCIRRRFRPAEAVEEFPRLPGNDVRARYDLHVVKRLIRARVCMCDPARADDAYP